MSKDVQFFCACDHIVDNKNYTRETCPRCYGKGYYVDIYFDTTGEAVLATGNIKLQQEILKIMIDQKYLNQFHPNWGSELNNSVGVKNLSITKVKLELVVRKTLEYLKNVQMNENNTWKNMTAEEILDKIEFIEIVPLGPDGFYVSVTLSNVAQEIMIQSITI